jgi:oligopeptide/dipeptide ABC transporter ATP-binding protein
MEPPVLEVQGLSIHFLGGGAAVPVAQDVSFRIDAGQTLGLVGESGAGKSITAMAVLGLVAPPAAEVRGSIRLRGRELSGMDQRSLGRIRGKEASIIFQEPRQSFNPAFTVGEQIAETLRWHEGASRRSATARSVELLELVGIDKSRQRAADYPHTFSGGMLQRAMIAMAIACRPALLIADEPTTALDVTVQAQILGLLKRLQATLGMAMLFVSHDMGVVAEVCDSIAVMYAGQVVENGTAAELLLRPRHPYTEALLRSVPDVHMAQRHLYAIPGSVPLPGRYPPGCRFHPRCAHVREQCRIGEIAMVAIGRAHAARCVRTHELKLTGASA